MSTDKILNIKLSEISDYFIAFSNTTGNLITNLKLQKLVYYAQAWHLAVYKAAIFEEDFEAWVHGPVIPELYRTYREFSWHPIEREDLAEEACEALEKKFPDSVGEIIADVLEEYFGMEAYALEKSTHNELPWIKTRSGLADDEPCDRIIDKRLMVDFYSQFVKNG